MRYAVKIFVFFFLINLFFNFELEAQQTQIDKARREELKSIRTEQWEHWYKTKRKLDSTRAAGQIEREAFLNSPLSKEYQESVRKKDSARYEGYQTLLDTIRQETKVLKLVNSSYKSIPPEIFDLKYLDSLNLGMNEISNFEVKFSDFSHLRFLNLYGNKLSDGTIKFDRNDSLSYLNLSENDFKKIPGSLRKLKGLKTLKISGNAKQGKSLKIRIYKWDSLKTLDLSNNNLKKIPRGIKKLKKLEVVNLSYNDIKTLKGLHHLDQIKEIEISFNPLFLDPKYLVSLPNLENLIIRGCGITYLPPEINQFSGLKKLVVPENRLKDVPREIGDFIYLENLMLYKNQLSDLPDEIYNLSNLAWLDVYYNDLKYLSPKIAKLQNLEILYLSYNKLRELPESIGEMTKLRELYLHHNQLRELPESISRLTNLKYLHVYDNHLTVFPQGVLELKKLEELNLSGNLIEYFPMEIAGYDHLSYIYLDNNNTDKKSQSYEYFKWALKQLQDKGVIIKFDY